MNNKMIPNAGGCIVSKNILNHQGQLRWAFRENPVNPTDNGWRFLSGIDDDVFVNNPQNMSVCDFNTMAEIEPAVIGIYLYPIGSDFQFVIEDGKRRFYDNRSGKIVEPKYEND